MKGVTKLLAAVGLIFAGPAWAAEWHRVSVTTTAVTYVDAESIIRTGNEVTAWTHRIWQWPTDSGMVSNNVRYSFRCTDRSYVAVYMVAYYQDGSSDGWAPQPSRDYAAPETTIDTMIRFACGDSSLGQRIWGDLDQDARESFARISRSGGQ